jgi:biopolymer transport protein ExbB
MRISATDPKRGRWVPMMAALVALLLIVQATVSAQAQQPSDAAPTTAPAAVAGDSSQVAPSLSPIDLFFKAGWFIYPLAACSVISVALIIERFVALRQGRVIPPGFIAGIRQVFQDPKQDREQGLQYCERHDSPLARIVQAGIRRIARGPVAAEKAMEDAGANEAVRLRQNMRFLYSLGSVATLLGLIGTIGGMIKAFQVASLSGPGHADKLSEGIYEAMVNTFAGLAVAIVVTIFYYYFVGRIEKLVSDLNDAVNQFEEHAGFDLALPETEGMTPERVERLL